MEVLISQVKYRCNPVHRNNMPGKTQWNSSISDQEEEDLFRYGLNENWLCSGNVFSLWIDNGRTKYLDINNKLNYARFTGCHEWHGWPADGKRSPKDIPSYEILKQWVAA